MRVGHVRNKKGFTLIEVLCVVVILGVLALVVVPRVLVSAQTSKINACHHNKAVINTSVEQWYFDKGAWPADNLNDIKADNNYFPDGIPTCPVDDSAYVLDGTTHRITGHAH